MNIVVSKFALTPSEAPTGYAVGFSVEENGKSFYREATVPLAEAEGLTDTQVAHAAYAQVKTSVEAQAALCLATSPILGKPYTPVA